jgi:hypothetical protein
MIPFDLASIDSKAVLHIPASTQDPATKAKGIIENIIDVAKEFLGYSGKEHEAAAVLLTRLLTRRDAINTHLMPFLSWCTDVANECHTTMDTTKSVFVLRGVLYALCMIYKYGPRNLLLGTLGSVLPICRNLWEVSWVKSNSLIRKLLIKLSQRVGLSYLKPKVAKWRYQRGSRSLAANLAKSSGGAVGTGGMATASGDGSAAAKLEADEEDEDYDVPEEIEEIIEMMLTGMRDKVKQIPTSAKIFLLLRQNIALNYHIEFLL